MVVAVSAAAHSDSLQTIGPDAVDIVHAGQTRTGLRDMLGVDRVSPARIGVGEGMVCDGSRLLFDGDNQLLVAWRDPENGREPALVHIKGRLWRTYEGLRLGSTLSDAARLNGGVFMLSGFGWDYGGTVGLWNGGHLSYLQRPDGSGLIVRFAPDRARLAALPTDRTRHLFGDRDLIASDDPSLRAVTAKISTLTLHFPGPACPAYFPE